MKGKRLRMRFARLLAAVYVMYVVMSGMAIPGVDGSYKPLIKANAAVGVTVSNNSVLKNSGVVGTYGVTTTGISDTKKVTYFTINKGDTYQNIPTPDIYSVKWNNKDYYYDPANTGNKEGLFWSDVNQQWGFVFPDSATDFSVQLQLVLQFNALQTNISVYNTGFQPSASEESYEQISDEMAGTELSGKLSATFCDYAGNTSYKSNIFSPSQLRFYCLNKETNHYTYRIEYGKNIFGYQGDSNTPSVLSIWTTETASVSAYRQKGTNQLVVDTNIADAEKWLQVVGYAEEESTYQLGYPSSVSDYLTYNNGTINGTALIAFEDGEFYLPLAKSSTSFSGVICYCAAKNDQGQGCSSRPYGSATNSTGKKAGRYDFLIYGPKSSTISKLEVGTSSNITENLKDTNNGTADFAGNVVQVGSTTVTENTPYEDEYVTIDYYGNVTAKKASGVSKSYSLTTQNKYTKLTKGAVTFRYATASGGNSGTPTGEYGEQTWPVSLTVTTTDSSSTTETTEEPTTQAPATYKATLSTTNSQTKIAAGDKTATGNNGSITLEAGQTVTVTPGTSTYGSTVTVSDSATKVDKKSNGTYTFTMPAKAITVTVTDITLSSISAVITGAGKTASSPYAFGAKTAAPSNTDIENACKQGALSITATLSDNTTRSVTAGEASYTVTKNTSGTATGTGDTITHPGTAVITISYGGKSTTVNYYYTYTTANQKTLQGITIAAKADSTLSTSSAAPTVFETKGGLPGEAVIKSQLGAITATYKDSLGKTSTETIANTAAGVELKVTTQEKNATVSGGVYTHGYVAQVAATYNGKTSNTVTFYYQYCNYSATCKTVDETGKDISATVKASVSATTDIAKGANITITTPEDKTLSYLKTKISVIGTTSKKDYSNTVSSNTFAMPGEPVEVMVAYTKLSDFMVTPPTKTLLDAAPGSDLKAFTDGGYLTLKYQGVTGSKVDLDDSGVALAGGVAEKISDKNGVSTYKIPVSVTFKGIEKNNAFSFTYEVKNKYSASVTNTEGPSVQFKTGNEYTTKVSGYYGDTITMNVPKETQEYAFPTVTVQSVDGTVIKTVTQSGEVTLTMPAANVTVTATWQKLTRLEITPPDTSDGEWSKQTKKENLPLGSIKAVYGSGSSARTKDIVMTYDMYTLGTSTDQTAENPDGSKTVTVTVPVTICVPYGGLTEEASFSYSYSYEVSANSKSISIGQLHCGSETLVNSGLVRVSQSSADPGSEISVTVKETPQYAFPTVYKKTVSGTEELTLSGTGDEKTATFTMPTWDVEIVVDYKPLSSITLTEPDKKLYDQYTKPEDLDLTGGSLTAVYGSSAEDTKTINLKTEAGVSNGCTIACTKGTAEEQNGVLVTPVTVSITYGGKTATYEYTYREMRSFSITLDEQSLPDDFVNKEQVRLSTTIGNYGDKVTLYLPADTDDIYAFPTVLISRGDTVEPWEPENGIYETTITSDMSVTVSYCKLSGLELTLPEEEDIKMFLPPIDDLDISGVKLQLVYYNDEEQEGGRKSISTSGYADFAYGKETESVTDGACLHTVPVLVTANYKDLVEAEGSYSVRYRNYVVSAQDVDGNPLTVDKAKANAGDTVVISVIPGLVVSKITANGTLVSYALSTDKTKATICLSEEMLSAKTGYTFVVAYQTQTIQDIEAPEEAVVVSDKIMTEEELKQALADLDTFDFGTASILVSYDETEPAVEIPLNNSAIAKELLEDKTTEKESADGTYIERTYIIKATIDGKSVEVPIIVKVQKKANASGDASGEGTESKTPGGTGAGEGGSPNTPGGNTEQNNNPTATSTKPGKVAGVKVAAKKRKLTVTWKAADNASAYEIWISTKKNGGYLKAATVKKSGSKKTYSYTVKKLDGSKLKKGKTYYVKVRAVNVKSKLAKKTITQTAKSKPNRRLYVTVKSVKNAVSYTVKASTKKKSGYKTIFKFDEIGKKKYTKYIKRQKRKTKYYIKVEVKVETGKRQDGAYSSVLKVKCK